MEVMEVCAEEPSECHEESASEFGSKLVWGDDENNWELRLVCVSVIVSELVLLMDAVSVDGDWPLDDTLSVVDPPPSPPPALQLSPLQPYHPVLGPAPSHSLRVTRAGHGCTTPTMLGTTPWYHGCTRVGSWVRCWLRAAGSWGLWSWLHFLSA